MKINKYTTANPYWFSNIKTLIAKRKNKGENPGRNLCEIQQKSKKVVRFLEVDDRW
jgi:hypothetical protein